MRAAISAIVGRLVDTYTWLMDVIADLVADTRDAVVAHHRGFALVVLALMTVLVVMTWPDLVVMLLWAAWSWWTLFVIVHLNGGRGE